jgi:serine phosphatase RsbU (regulator of sigma subunit)
MMHSPWQKILAFYRNLSIKLKFFFTMAAVLFFAIPTLSYLFINQSENLLIRSLEERVELLNENFSVITRNSLQENSFTFLQAMVRDVVSKQKEMRAFVITDARGNILASNDEQTFPLFGNIGSTDIGPLFAARQSINRRVKSAGLIQSISFVYAAADRPDSLLASMYVSLTTDYLEKSLRNLWLYSLLLIVVMAGLAFWAAYRAGRHLARPITSLAEDVREIASGNLEVKIRAGNRDEIGQLIGDVEKMQASIVRMIKEINQSKGKIQEYADHLEDMVKDRTEELRTSLEQVQALKNQQDADYYLTTLLILPLRVNQANNRSINVQFIVRQKKQFMFRQWEVEIGGDICIAHSVQLLGRSFTVFLNGDAMGKSIQGAGGALVLGAVFQSIIERTRISDMVKNFTPEQWIKNTFIELSKVFLSFDGATYASLVLGAIDEASGIMHYINADHPPMVLYRNGKAEFIDTEVRLKKLGFAIPEETVSVRELQLMPHDIVVAGSDGRDDLLLMESEDKNIYADEGQFLQRVQEAEGNLEGILEGLIRTGKLTDDLSLLRIRYER